MPRLRRSQPAGPGYTRVSSGETSSYQDPSGAPVADADLIARFDALVLPPAWTDVWLCPYPNGHIQATGVDAAGRRQYHYHPAWRARMDAIKFDRALDLAEVLPAIRPRVRRSLKRPGLPRERALAAAFRMLDVASLRVGSEKYALEHGSFGLASLLWPHATVDGTTVTLDFPAKSHHHWRSDVVDGDLAAFVKDRHGAAELSGIAADNVTDHVDAHECRLLAFEHEGAWHSVTPHDINEQVRTLTGGHFSAKDFRTLHGTIAAATYLADAGHVPSEAKRNRIVAAAMRSAAETLNNTPAVARASYVDPRVVDHYHHGRTIDPAGVPEAELLRLVAPDRSRDDDDEPRTA